MKKFPHIPRPLNSAQRHRVAFAISRGDAPEDAERAERAFAYWDACRREAEADMTLAIAQARRQDAERDTA